MFLDISREAAKEIVEREITSLIEANRMQTKQAEEFKDKKL